ncbi:TonB-dependent siderophore receptor [Paucibacter sp. KBW04]|uniref:TonB-dependent siderophore receptor n=1 Tax=Paucibacter sp. KBW04 TaxID=2153361 RepID=UPI000F57BBAB|nr:TonB-dependent siderophore receptor [Paucibacter sp. KBW04]RQO62369.1 TonB-dependent siderophore receptor [Paucibacter sp. KBW04]
MAYPQNSRSFVAAAALLSCSAAALAQSTLPSVTVTGRSADTPVSVGGFGETPIAKLPMQASILNAERLQDLGLSNLAGITALDASVGDAYNSSGYVSYLKIRGFDLDNRFNYRRDGLPINAETALSLGNKTGLEVLKGSSGIQAGTSSPGGLVNLLVKRPTAKDLTVLGLSVSERGTVDGSVDLSRRFGESQAFGLRLNASAAQLKPQLYDADGNRQLFALAGDWRVSPSTLLEAEVEWNRQSQPSQPGFSLLGDKLPDAKAIDPRINLNNQSWSQPVVFNNQHASLRLTQKLSADWTAQAHLGVQRLKTDDRLAYANGLYDPNTYDCDPCDRYSSTGTFSVWDFRSENERRNSDALDLNLSGKFSTAGLKHQLGTGVLFSRFNSRFQRQAYNLVGVGNIQGTAQLPSDPSLSDENTNRDERSTEFYLRDSVQLGADWQVWAGLRHTRLQRDSVRTDGSRATSYSQAFTTPWLGLGYNINSQLMAYASWGEGVESEVTPNRKRYGDQAGQALAALKSKQLEVGLKAGSNTVDWSLNWFDVQRPSWRDIGICKDATPGSCERRADGNAHHQGFEAQADLKWSGGGLLASAMKLKARREGSADDSLNGLRPANVPENSLRLQARQNLPALPGLQVQLGLVYEGPRAVLPDNSINIPGWSRIDAGARYEQLVGKTLLTWRVGVDNLSNRRAWKESPFQFDHVYLYPLAPRTWRTSFEISL